MLAKIVQQNASKYVIFWNINSILHEKLKFESYSLLFRNCSIINSAETLYVQHCKAKRELKNSANKNAKIKDLILILVF